MDILPTIGDTLGPATTTYFVTGPNGAGCNALIYDSTKQTGKVTLISAPCAGGANIGYICAT